MALRTDRRFAVQVTPGREAKAVAFIIGILGTLYIGDVKKVLKAVATFYGLAVIE